MSGLPPQLQPSNPVQDPVHGRIWLTRPELELINTPEFQRLRLIGQLTPVDLVFPGATHSRFAHSIGAMHVMGLMLAQKPLQDYFKLDRPEMVEVLRVAALLHDVGHLPFSHVGEMAWNAAGADDAFTYADSEEVSVFDVASAARAKPALHEELSELLILNSGLTSVLDGHLPWVDGRAPSEVVAQIVSGNHPDIVARNLLSSDLDCDRLDYLLRDSAAAGLVYGKIDLDYLIGNLAIGCDAEGPFLAIDRRHGIRAGEHFLLARYYHYAQFISHKTVAAAEIGLVAAMIELIRLGELPTTRALTEGDDQDRVRALLSLTDARVVAALGEAATRHPGEADLVEAAQRFMGRKLLKVAADRHGLEDSPTPDNRADAHRLDQKFRRRADKAATADECRVDTSRFCYRRTTLPLTGIEGDISPATAMREPDRIRHAWRKGAKVSGGDEDDDLLISASPVLRHLSHQRWATRRVFYRESLDRYSPRTPSPEFNRLHEYCASELRPA